MASLKVALETLSADFLGKPIRSVRSAAEKIGMSAPISVKALVQNIPDFAPGTLLTQDLLNARHMVFKKYIELGGAQGVLGRIPGPILVLGDGKNVVLKCENGFVVSTPIGRGSAGGSGGGYEPKRQYQLTLEKIKCYTKTKRITVGNEANRIWMRFILTSTMPDSPIIYNIKDMGFDTNMETTVNRPLYSGELPFQFTVSLLGIETYDPENVELVLGPFEYEATHNDKFAMYDLGGANMSEAQLVKCLTDTLPALPFLGGLGILVAWIVDAASGRGTPAVVAKSSMAYTGEAFYPIYSSEETPDLNVSEIRDIPDILLLRRSFTVSKIPFGRDLIETQTYYAHKDAPGGACYELTFRHQCNWLYPDG
jgi:hypothetical protein